jgi:hypothetical protein
MQRDVINLIISWIIVLVFILTVQVGYKEDYQDVFIFLSFFVVLIPLIFSTTWLKGIINTIISFLGLLLITLSYWYIVSINSDFAFENYVPYSGMMLSSLKGIALGVLLKFIYLVSKKMGNRK